MKKIFTLALALVMSLSLVACGGEKYEPYRSPATEDEKVSVVHIQCGDNIICERGTKSNHHDGFARFWLEGYDEPVSASNGTWVVWENDCPWCD